ncbi:MAG: 1-acyl-sn-glycerol-3-phosphate acyltransferase [Candidatus Atribacteria bacterium]|nr:1-acyl-sn-glycerol-3-phosphate acyltransferase [Candidatus Atribacteria bacterium]
MNNVKKAKKFNSFWGSIIKFFSNTYLHGKLDIIVSKNDARNLKPPFLILANHVTYWDPFLVDIFVKEPMCYLAEETYFRNPWFRIVLNAVDSIPKKRYIRQSQPIKKLFQARDIGRVMGIFPEGERNWDGITNTRIFPATAKLIKKLGVPVITVVIEGGYLAYPRWAKYSRRGKVNLTYKLSITKDEVTELPLEQIEERIKSQLAHDEVEYQRKMLNKYVGKNLAENLELLLYLCPQCHSMNTLISHGDNLTCQHCQYGVVYTQYGFLEGLQNKLYFDNLRDWNCWQVQYLKELIAGHCSTKGENEDILKDDGVEMLVGSIERPFISKGKGVLSLHKRALSFQQPAIEKFQFDLTEIIGLNVQFLAVLEFSYKDELYRFKFQNPHISAYKWEQAINFTREEIKRD